MSWVVAEAKSLSPWLRVRQVAERHIPPSVPAWSVDTVLYQVFPLGFLGAPCENELKGPVVPRLAQLRDYYDHFQVQNHTRRFS